MAEGLGVVYCASCGAELKDTRAKFCQSCGKEIAAAPVQAVAPVAVPTPKKPRSMARKVALGIVIGAIVLVVGLVLVVVLVALSESDGNGGNPFDGPTYSASLSLKIVNDDWLTSHSFTIYIDGQYSSSGSLNPNTYEYYFTTVTWQGEDAHQCAVLVKSGSQDITKSVYLTDGGGGSVSVTL